MADAGLIAGDTRSDVFGGAPRRLVGHVGVADERPRHAAHVGVTARDHRFRILRLIDSAGDENWNPCLPFDAGGVGDDIGCLQGHGRRDVNRAAQARGRSDRDVHIVDAVIEANHRIEGLILRQALLVGFRSRYSEPHDEILGHFGADVGDHLTQEAQAGVEIAAVGIVAQVDAGVQELRRQIAVTGDDLDTVQTGRLHAPGRIAVAVHDGVDHGALERTRHDVKSFVRNRGGRVRDAEQATIRLCDLAAGMEQLPEQHGPVAMHRLRDAAVARNGGIVRCHQHMIGITGGFMDPRYLQHDQTDAAARTRFLIGHQLRIDRSVHRQRGVVSRGHDSVVERAAANAQRFE